METHLDNLINKKKERAYDIRFEKANLHFLLNGISIKGIQIIPLTADSGTYVVGDVKKAEMYGVNWFDLFFERKIEVKELAFIEPSFIIKSKKSAKPEKSRSLSFQRFFGDILSRGKIHAFVIEDGQIQIYREDSPEREYGYIHDLDLEALDIETDSLQWKYPIPFKIGLFQSTIGKVKVNLNEDQTLEFGPVSFDSDASFFSLKNLNLSYNKPWIEVNRKIGKQIDLIEVDLHELKISGMGANSRIYGELEVRANKIEIDGLDLRDHRNKNMPRPPDKEKPMFFGMIQQIPIPLEVDTLQVKRSRISYTELGENKQNPGTILFNDLFGTVYKLSTIKEIQEKFGTIEGDFIGQMNKHGFISARLVVPYRNDDFWLKARLDSFDVTQLNNTMVPMADVDMKSGFISKMILEISANRNGAESKLILDYEDMAFEVFRYENDKSYKKLGALSNIANMAIKHHNRPGTSSYKTAEYYTKRNINRSPFNLIWNCSKDGFINIVPSNTARALMDLELTQNSEKTKKGRKHKWF